MEKLPFNIPQIFSSKNDAEFSAMALAIFRFQYENNTVYQSYVDLLKVDIQTIDSIEKIPFLPISFFKTHEVKSFESASNLIFKSSGTTGMDRSTHHIFDPTLYQMSFIKGFEEIYGHIEDYIILGLLPSYMDNDDSSLIYMVDHLIELTKDNDSGFFLNDNEKLLDIISKRKNDKKIMLIGVSYALLDLAEQFHPDLSSCIVVETGGMKGRRKELTKDDLHAELCSGLNVAEIHSEYGMSELLSQAYSIGGGLFKCPSWMRVLIREHNDPFNYLVNRSGGINVIDFANIYSCSFIATQDLGRIDGDGFHVLGRFDNSDIRGCNLLIQ